MDRRDVRKLQSVLFSMGLAALALGAVRAGEEQSGLVRVILGQDEANASLDINGDGTIDSADVVKLALLLTPTPTPVPTQTPTVTPSPTPDPTLARVVTEIVSGNPCGPVGSTFAVGVRVAENPSGLLPAAASYRLHYPAERARFVSLAPGQLGTAEYGPETTTTLASLPSHYRNVATFSNWDNTDTTPEILVANFEVVADGPAYSIALMPDPNAIANLVDRRLQNIRNVTDSSATSGICALVTPTASPTTTPLATETPITTPTLTLTPSPSGTPYPETPLPSGTPSATATPFATGTPLPTTTPTDIPTTTTPTPGASGTPQPSSTPSTTPSPTPLPRAVIVPQLLSGDACSADSTFVVRVPVVSNTTSQTPISGSIRVYYPADLLDFVSVAQGDLGSTATGPELFTTTAGLPSNYRNITTFSNFANRDSTPVICDVTFRTKSDFVRVPYTIVVDDDTRSSGPLIDSTFANIAHVFDNNRLGPVCVVLSPTPSLSPTLTATPSPETTYTPTPSATAWITPTPETTYSPTPSATAWITPTPETIYSPTPSATVLPSLTPETKYGGLNSGRWRLDGI